MEKNFNGFPREFAEFLFSLRLNNTREAIEENKSAYNRLITEPLTQLYNALMPTALSVSKTVETNYLKCVSAMCTDMRYSAKAPTPSPKLPIRESMYIHFYEGFAFGDKNRLGLYFDMGCENYGCGIRVERWTGDGMERVRDYALANSPEFTRELENLSNLGMAVLGEKFTLERNRFSMIENKVLKDFLHMKNFYIERSCPINESVFNGGLADEIAEAFRGVKGIYLMLKRALQR